MKITRIILYCLLCFLSPFSLYCQGEWNTWYFSTAGLTFNPGYPVLLTNSNMHIGDGSTISISDSLGYFLFSSLGEKVFNRLQEVMPNGDGLLGSWNDNQPVYAIPSLNDDSSYYIFTVGNQNFTTPWANVGLFYSLLNLRLDGGLGDIDPSIKNIPVPGGENARCELTATRHQNNHNVWLVSRDHVPGHYQYLSFLIDSNGINLPVSSNSFLEDPYGPPVEGLIKISYDGTKLVYVKYFDGKIEYCNFDRLTGAVSPLFWFKVPSDSIHGPWGAEFSIDSKYLYISSGGLRNPAPGLSIDGPVHQYDATKTDLTEFVNSVVSMCECVCGNLQMGPDWKIYGARNYNYVTHSYLMSIDNPSYQGLACNINDSSIDLFPKATGRSLPQFLQKYKAYIHHFGQCQYDSIYFSGDIWPLADSIHWDFGDPTSGASNYSNLPNPIHTYALPGNYTVTLFVKHIDNRTDTSWKTISIYSKPAPDLGNDQTICSGDSVTFDAGFCSGCTYQWANLTMGYLNIGTGQNYKTGEAAIYMVSVTSSNGCIGRDTVQLFTSPVPTITNNPLSKSVCSGESTNIVLISNVPAATFNWTATLTSGNVTGYSADSGLVIDQVLINSLSTPGIVIYHITPKVGNCIGTMVDFPVTVNAGDSVKVSISSSTNNICEGTPVTFTAVPTNGGTNPSYQWKVNGIIVGSNNAVYIYSPNSGDIVTCILTSSNTVCTSNNPATSNTITMIVNPNLPVSISISATPSGAVCSGTSVTFTAIPTNGGTTPQYQWKINGISVGTNSSTYSYIPVNGDQVKCILTSSEICTSNNPATSNTLSMTINNNLLVGVSISASVNPVCRGIPVTFTAVPTNGGSTPQYQWKVNVVNVGSNNPVYTYTPASGDQVSCILTSNLTCTSNNPATSNTLTMTINNPPAVTFTRCFDSITTTNAKPLKLKGGIPLGGTYSGPGVTAGIFYPSIAGVGIKTIIYTYTNTALCTATSSLSIINYQLSIFNCGSLLIDIRDGKTYPTVQIGSQCWIAANLNYGTMILSSSHQRDNCIPEKYCYNDLTANCQLVTANYQWDELMQYDDTPGLQGLCPPGWHVPTENDWNTLFANYINNAFAGSPLKYSGYSGFNALLTGARFMNKTWSFDGFATYFWSSTAHGSLKAWAHAMNDYDPSVAVYPAFRSNALSVRCLKD